MPFFPYATVSEFFEVEGDFAENLVEDAPGMYDEPDYGLDLLEDEDPCCLLYRQTYLEDHEWDCPRRVAKDRL